MAEEDAPFIVRAWPLNGAHEPTDTRMPTLAAALAHAQEVATLETCRTAMVTDDRSMEWARFNMLWSIPEEFRG